MTKTTTGTEVPRKSTASQRRRSLTPTGKTEVIHHVKGKSQWQYATVLKKYCSAHYNRETERIGVSTLQLRFPHNEVHSSVIQIPVNQMNLDIEKTVTKKMSVSVSTISDLIRSLNCNARQNSYWHKGSSAPTQTNNVASANAMHQPHQAHREIYH